MGDSTPLDINVLPKSKVKQYTGKITDIPAPPDTKYEEPMFAKEPQGSEIFGDNPPAYSLDNKELQELHRFNNEHPDVYKRNVLWLIFLSALITLFRINTYIIIKLFFFFGGFLLNRYVSDIQNNLTAPPSACERPAAGAGGSSTNPPPVARGRRHVRTSLFETECNEYGLSTGPAAGFGPQFDKSGENQEIFSVKGTRSIKINRHRDTVNVFPSGCMGIPQDGLAKIPEDHVTGSNPDGAIEPALIDFRNESIDTTIIKEPIDYESPTSTPRSLDGEHPNATVSGEESVTSTPRSIVQNTSSNNVQYRRTRPLSAVQRNPLTGVGYEDHDFIRQGILKKRDGNPVLGKGYETKDISNKTKKIPPGGYSRGLW